MVAQENQSQSILSILEIIFFFCQPDASARNVLQQMFENFL